LLFCTYLCMFMAVVTRRRANFYLDEELLLGLKSLKAQVGIPESEAVRRAVAEYLERHGVTKPERKRAATRKRP
jgi:ribbon-helix-helix protein